MLQRPGGAPNKTGGLRQQWRRSDEKRKPSILIVDDEAIVRRVLRQRLTGEGYECREAGNADEALAAVAEHKPALIIMDLLMPVVDGYTACYKIKADPETKDIPLVVLTAVGHDLNRKLAEKMGADGYMTKPFEKKELLKVANKYIKK